MYLTKKLDGGCIINSTIVHFEIIFPSSILFEMSGVKFPITLSNSAIKADSSRLCKNLLKQRARRLFSFSKKSKIEKS